MRIPFSHTPNYDPAAPIRNFSKTRHHARTHDDTTSHKKNKHHVVPCSLCLSRQPSCDSDMHGYLHRKSTAQRMMRSDQSRTRYFPWKSAQRRQRRGDDHHQTMMCVPYAYHVNRLLIAISMSTIIRIERDIE